MARRGAVGRLAVATGLALVAAGCSSSTGTSGAGGLNNPTATTAKIKSVDTTFKTPAFNSFRGLSGRFIPMSPPVAALLQATVPEASVLPQRPYAAVTRHALAVRAGLSSGVIRLSIILPQYLGKTYVLTSATAAYSASSRTGAPSNGVRFILYAVDPVTDQVATPLTETGYVDLIDLSTASTNSLEVKVVSGGTTFADYTISGSYSSTAATLTLAGFVTDGTTRVNFTITYAANSAAGTYSETSAIDAPSQNFHLGFNLSATSAVSGTVTTVTFTLDFNLTAGSDAATAHGTITTTYDSSNGASTDNGTISVTANGHAFATITITTTGTTITGSSGQALPADQQTAVTELFGTGAVLEVLILLLFVPFLLV